MCVAVLGILGGVVSGIGAAMGAKAEAASLEAQAAFKDRQAGIEKQVGAYKAARTQDQVDRTLGSQRAGFAANGISGGSVEDTIDDTATEGALDVAAIRWNSNLAADNLKYQAKMDRMNAKTTRRSASLAFIAPVLGSVAQFGGEFGSSFGSTA